MGPLKRYRVNKKIIIRVILLILKWIENKYGYFFIINMSTQGKDN